MARSPDRDPASGAGLRPDAARRAGDTSPTISPFDFAASLGQVRQDYQGTPFLMAASTGRE